LVQDDWFQDGNSVAKFTSHLGDGYDVGSWLWYLFPMLFVSSRPLCCLSLQYSR
jgi:hypothetical protein